MNQNIRNKIGDVVLVVGMGLCLAVIIYGSFFYDNLFYYPIP